MAKTAVTSDNDEEHPSLKINNTKICIKLDSGAETNVLTKKYFETAVPKRQRRSKLKTSAAKLTGFGSHNIPVIGKCYLRCQYKGESEVLEFQVVETGKSLLGCTNCKSMTLITFHNVDQLRTYPINDASPQSSLHGLTSDQIFEKYSKCFDGLGRISDPYHIKINPDATPVVHPPRKLPSALRDRVQNELQDMESRGIIKKVNEPTAWVNSMVVNEKRSGKLRICIDPRDLNKALRREHYQHDQNLERVLNRVTDINMTLSKDKCQFRQTKITYLGETLTAHGVKPDETKVEAIKNYLRTYEQT